MRRALELAQKGGRQVAPNPRVGAVIVKASPDRRRGKGQVIGEGYHRVFGGPHAEVEAIHSVQNPEALKGATLYVTLEPCRHFGKTPPCWDLVQSVGITRVVVGSQDPFQEKFQARSPKIQNLSKHETSQVKQNVNFKIEFLSGGVAQDCWELNKFFFTWVEKKRPFITVKVALSADGFVAGSGGAPVRFTSPEQDKQVHQLRSAHQAIMVGTATVLSDNPELNVRHVKGVDPLRIILDRTLKIPLQAKVFKDSNVLLATRKWTSSTPCPSSVQHKLKGFQEKGIQVWESPGKGEIDLKALLTHLAEQGIASVLVEPGPTLYRSLKAAGLIDEWIVLRGERKLKEGLRIEI